MCEGLENISVQLLNYYDTAEDTSHGVMLHIECYSI